MLYTLHTPSGTPSLPYIYTLYIYVHPLYMYIDTIHTHNTPLNTLYNTPHIHPIYTPIYITTWKVSPSNLISTGGGPGGGEAIDDRNAVPDWNTVGMDDSKVIKQPINTLKQPISSSK